MTRTVDRYHMHQTLGKGGFGKVKYGIDPRTGQAVALKIMRSAPETLPVHLAPPKVPVPSSPPNAYATNANSPDAATAITTTTTNTTTTNTPTSSDGKGNNSNTAAAAACAAVISEMPTNGGTRYDVLMREVELLRQLNHPRIIKILDVVPRAAYQKANGQYEEMMLLVMELADSGDLHDLILLFQDQGMGELVARTYFHQLLDGVLYCHRRGVVHLDLKPENIFLDREFQLKIGDFGLSRPFDASTRMMRTPCGTRQFASPEVFSQQGYDGCLADMWSCSTILFCMVAGNPPFALPARTDWWFDKLLTQRHELFWRGHPRSERFTPEFKDFILAMLQPVPANRLTFDKMLAHPWFTGPVLHPNTLYQYISSRKLQRSMPASADTTDEGSLERGIENDSSEEVYRSLASDASAGNGAGVIAGSDELPPRPPAFYSSPTSLPAPKKQADAAALLLDAAAAADANEPGAPGSVDAAVADAQVAALELSLDDDDDNVYRNGPVAASGNVRSQHVHVHAQQQQPHAHQLTRESVLSEDAILASLPVSIHSLPSVLESVTTIPSAAPLSVLFIELHRFLTSLRHSIAIAVEPSTCTIRVRLLAHDSKFVVQLQSSAGAKSAAVAAAAGASAASSSPTSGGGGGVDADASSSSGAPTVWIAFRREFGNRTKFLRLFDQTLQHFRQLHLVYDSNVSASDRAVDEAAPASAETLRERFAVAVV